MKRTRRIYYSIMAACYLAGMYSGLRIYFLVFATQLFAVIAVVLLNLWTIYVITYKQELGKKVSVKGGETVLHLDIRNERPVPLSLVEVHVDVVSMREDINLVFSLPPHAWKEFHIPVSTPYRGKFQVGMTNVRVTDIFGLTTLRIDMRRRPYYRMQEMLVLPKAETQGAVSASMADAKLFRNSYLRQSVHGDSVSSARLFQTGDELKRVHWKKSAQQGALFVKQYERPEREQALVLIDTFAHGLTGEDALVYADTVCECAMSIALHNVLRGRVVQVLPGDTQEPTEYANVADMEKLQQRLALLQFEHGGLLSAITRASGMAGAARALFVLTREAAPALTDALERSLMEFSSVTLVLVGGSRESGRVYTLYVEPGCNAAQALDSIE
ncbi:MAG TPA: DUF58 domain-containing protein [Feifaniaceae bacterium]|nr:DUF58 domain-containing protein [Feifaniaceae bacterium]